MHRIRHETSLNGCRTLLEFHGTVSCRKRQTINTVDYNAKYNIAHKLISGCTYLKIFVWQKF